MSLSPSLFQSLPLFSILCLFLSGYVSAYFVCLSVCACLSLSVCLSTSFCLHLSFLSCPCTCPSVLALYYTAVQPLGLLDSPAAAAASSAGDSRALAATEPAPFIGVKSPSTDRQLITRTVSKNRLLISETIIFKTAGLYLLSTLSSSSW